MMILMRIKQTYVIHPDANTFIMRHGELCKFSERYCKISVDGTRERKTAIEENKWGWHVVNFGIITQAIHSTFCGSPFWTCVYQKSQNFISGQSSFMTCVCEIMSQKWYNVLVAKATNKYFSTRAFPIFSNLQLPSCKPRSRSRIRKFTALCSS